MDHEQCLVIGFQTLAGKGFVLVRPFVEPHCPVVISLIEQMEYPLAREIPNGCKATICKEGTCFVSGLEEEAVSAPRMMNIILRVVGHFEHAANHLTDYPLQPLIDHMLEIYSTERLLSSLVSPETISILFVHGDMDNNKLMEMVIEHDRQGPYVLGVDPSTPFGEWYNQQVVLKVLQSLHKHLFPIGRGEA